MYRDIDFVAISNLTHIDGLKPPVYSETSQERLEPDLVVKSAVATACERAFMWQALASKYFP